MHSDLRALIALWQFDSKLRSLQSELKSFPAEERRRQTRLDAAMATRDRIESELAKRKASIAEIEADVTAMRERIKKIDVEQGRARDNKTLYAFQHQVQTLRQEISERDDEGLKILERVTELDADLESARKRVAEEEQTMAGFRANAERESAQVRAKADAMKAERGKYLEGIGPNTLLLYDELTTGSGEPVAAVADRTCQGCFTTLTPNIYAMVRAAKVIVQCSSCRRILFER